VFEDRTLRKMFGPKRDEVTREWRKLNNDELKDQNSSPNTVQVTKARRIRCAGHLARMGEKRGAYRGLVGKPEEKRPLGRPRDRWIILSWIFRKWDVGVWTGSSRLRIGIGGGHL
jgi:hypothetical protein